uniref:Prolyl 3-hydroxylase family member 4 (inactive) n=1 Tax=Astyanax mexicanus TaxID=7994 RepID=W5LER6_ASTMX
MHNTYLMARLLNAAVRAQYEGYSFSSFPESELMPLDSAYGTALDFFGSERWKDSVRMLELSLRIHRLLRDSEATCARNCSLETRRGQGQEELEPGLRVMEHFLRRAACLKRCKAALPVFSKAYPKPETLEAFQKREPYRYLQYAYFQRFTPLIKSQNIVVINLNVSLQAVFLKGVKLYNAGDFSRSVPELERACEEYMKAYEVCVEVCEGSYDLKEFKDFYPTLAGQYTHTHCKVKCEDNLMPNVGGFFVEKFVATMYHYLQFAYYKLNDVRNSAPCALSYMLFDSSDPVMKQNVEYYRFYREQWGLTEDHFKPRPEALQYFNQTTKQKEMLEFAHNYLQPDDEDVVSPEEAAAGPSSPPDEEFEGLGDYEESFLAQWWQDPKTKGDTGEAD